MPDSGHNGYLSVAPDETVVVPTNLTPDGVIAAGDLATHGDIAAALEGAVFSPDELGREAVFGAPGVLVTSQYLVSLAVPCGSLTTHVVDFDGTDSPIGWGWSTWSICGHVLNEGAAPVAPPYVTPSSAANHLDFTFVSLASGLSFLQAIFGFVFIGTP